jgi:hypothetical protein
MLFRCTDHFCPLEPAVYGTYPRQRREEGNRSLMRERGIPQGIFNRINREQTSPGLAARGISLTMNEMHIPASGIVMWRLLHGLSPVW